MMKSRQIGFTAAVAFVASLAFSVACGDQPIPNCVTGRGEFAARYTVLSGPPSCSARQAGVIGVQSYNLSAPNGAPDLTKVPIAIQDVTVLAQATQANYVFPPGEGPYAQGIFATAKPGDDNLCHVNMTSVAHANLPAAPSVPLSSPPVPASFVTPAAPARDVTYEWSNLTFFVRAASAGTQFQATLKQTTISPPSSPDGTSSTEICSYHVFAVFPSVSCGAPDAKDVQNQRRTVEDAPRCLPSADPSIDTIYGNPVGSFIDPDFATVCEAVQDVTVHSTQPTQFLCLPKGNTLPALN